MPVALSDLAGRPAAGVTGQQRLLAILGGSGLHLLMALVFCLTARGVVPAGAQAAVGEGDAVEITLSGREGGAAARGDHGEATTSEQSQLDRLVDRLRMANSDLYATETEAPRAKGDLASLFDGPATGTGNGRQGDGAGKAGRQDDGGDRDRTAFASQQGAGGDRAGAAGLLWGQVRPCWTRLPGRSAVPVVLELALTGDGRLAKPPKIIRPGADRPTEERLLAEARALQAITACLPYAEATGMGLTQRVSFPGG